MRMSAGINRAEALVRRAFQSAVGWSLAATALRLGSAFLILPLILRRVPPAELGLWYVFLSFGFLASLMDFGFASAVTRSTSFLWAGARRLLPLGIETENDITRDETAEATRQPNRPMLADFVASVRCYYIAIGAVLLIVLLTAGGAWIWHKTAPFEHALSLRMAFVVYVAAVVFAFVNGFWLYLLNGVNGVRTAQQIATGCALIYYVLAISGLLAGFQLWALVIATLIVGVLERVMGRVFFKRTAQLSRGRFDAGLIRILWPNAWRAGLVAVGGYLVVHANTLICSAFLDLEATASYGLTAQAIALLAGVSSVWVTVKLPLFNQLRALSRVRELASLFKHRIQLTILTYVAGAAVLLLFGDALLGYLGAKTHFLAPGLLALFLVIQLLETHHSMYGAVVISENVNPFWKPALLSGIAVVVLSFFLTPRIGVSGMLLSVGVVQLCYNNWWPILRAMDGLSIPRREYWRFWIPVYRP
jgi:O-antigen/teichoic acid export membrane protein